LELKDMSDDLGSKDKSFEALDFIINVLRDHEKVLDKSIHELATVSEQMRDTEALNSEVGKLEEKMNNLQKDVKNLIGYLSNSPKEAALKIPIKPLSQTQITPATFPAPAQMGQYVTLHCKQWIDFENVASKAQTISFNYHELDKILQVQAIKGNIIIVYTGVVPNFSLIIKNWLSRQLDTTEGNISEGYFDKSC
jgi:hypothetical protein